MKLKLFIVTVMALATMPEKDTLAQAVRAAEETTVHASKAEKEVAARVEQLREAMTNPTREALTELTLPQLNYGHSGGTTIENQEEFIQTLLTGKSDFVKIDLSDQKITVVGNTATVRHTFQADTNDGGKPGTVKMYILTVWVKQAGKWRMLARQAVRAAAPAVK